MDLSIIIVNWNSKDYLRKCLISLCEHTRAAEYEVIVIDSGSFDGCDRMLRESYPHVRFIQCETNVGFARANNRAFEESSGAFLLFLNPDTELSGPAIDILYSHIRSRPKAGVVGGKLLNGDGTIQTSCVQAFPTIVNQILDSEFLRAQWPKSRLWGMASVFEPGIKPHRVHAVSGACLFVRRTVFEQIGRFTEEYFMYAEDIDLAYKAQEAGFTNYFVPHATVIHYGGSSSQTVGSSFASVMMREAIARFFRRTRGRTYASAYRAAMFASALGRLSLLWLQHWMGGQASQGSNTVAIRKWTAILQWSLGNAGLVKEYYSRDGHVSLSA